MRMVFSAEKMLKRLEEEGRMNEVRKEDRELMEKLDGKVGNDYNWESFVHDKNLVWIEKGPDNPGAYVCREDCTPYYGED